MRDRAVSKDRFLIVYCPDKYKTQRMCDEAIADCLAALTFITDSSFYTGSNHDYYFIINVLAEEFKKQLTCLGEDTEKYITFTVPIEKEVTRIDKNAEEITENISYALQLLIAQHLWQARYQILSITFLKEFI